MDIVFIRELKINTIIGIYDWERQVRQTVTLDIEMATDINKAALSDNIKDTLDYKAVSERLIEFIENSEFQLIETMAEQCADIILNEFHVPGLRLRLSKPGAVRDALNVGVLIERGEKI